MAARRDAIHIILRRDEATYFAECLEFAVVTQGRTLDEVVENSRQAISLHVEGENKAALRLTDHPHIQFVCDMPLPSFLGEGS